MLRERTVNKMRLINADALMEQIKSPYTEYPIMIHFRKAIKDFIDSAPTIDAVPVVRCGECVNSQKDEIFGGIWCNGRKVWTDHFCSCGKRREDGAT